MTPSVAAARQAQARARARIVGRLGRGEAWFGFGFEPDGPRLVFGGREGVVQRPAGAGSAIRRRDLALAAIAFFEEAAITAPSELEVTQGDLADVVRWLVEREPESGSRRLLARAVDAIDDGLAGEAISALLREALAETGDSLELLNERYRSTR